MRASTQKIVALFMLAVLLASLGAYSFNQKLLKHGFTHGNQTLGALADHDHPELESSDNAGSDSLNKTEHQLLHAAAHMLPFLGSSSHSMFVDTQARVVPILWHLLSLPPARNHPPFRPPRTSYRI